MQIAVVGFNFSLIGGLEIVSKAIASVLARRGHRVKCLGLYEQGRLHADGYDIVGLSPRSAVIRSISHRIAGLAPKTALRRHLRQADVVVVAHAHTLRQVLPAVDALASRPKVLCWLHGREVWAGLGVRIAPLLRRADRLVAVSHYTAGVVHEMLPDAATPAVIHNPVDTNIFVPTQSPADIRRHHMLTVGRHDLDSRHKGYDVLIDSMELLARQRPDLPLHLTITGSGPLLDEHRRRIADRGMGARITLAGRVSRDELRSLYRTSDVFTLPSRFELEDGQAYGEGFGVVNAEAAACGRPVITSTHGGCPETVIEGVTGFAVDPTSPAVVAESIAKMFDMSADERDAMGARGRAMAVERFSVPVFEDAVGRFVEGAAAEPQKPLPGAGPR